MSFGTFVALLYIYMEQVIAQSTADIYTTYALEKRTSAILEFYIRFRF